MKTDSFHNETSMFPLLMQAVEKLKQEGIVPARIDIKARYFMWLRAESGLEVEPGWKPEYGKQVGELMGIPIYLYCGSSIVDTDWFIMSGAL